MCREEEMFAVFVFLSLSSFFSSPFNTVGSAQSMQFSNRPKEDSVEHIISRENAEM